MIQTSFVKARRGTCAVVMALLCSQPMSVRSQGVWVTDSSTDFIPRYDFASGVVAGKIYVIGGDESPGNLQVFDPAAHTWSSPVFAGDATLTMQTAYATVGNKIYLMGGFDDQQYNRNLIVVDPESRTVARPSTIGDYTPRTDAACAAVDNHIYLFGGLDTTSHLQPAVEMFDVSSYTWSVVKTTGPYTGLNGMTASVVDGRIYLIGGSDDEHNYLLSDTVQVFDPAANAFTRPQVHGFFMARRRHAAGVIDGKIYIAGGGGGSFPLEWTHDPDTTELQIFDPATNTWTTSKYGGLFTSRIDLCGEVIGGKFYTIGGYRPHGPTSYVEVYDPNGTDAVDPESGAASRAAVIPNPATDVISIVNASDGFRIFDALGRLVETLKPSEGESTSRLDIRALTPGVYSLLTGTQVVRFVKL